MFMDLQPHRSLENNPERNGSGQPRIIMDNNRVHFVNPQNIFTVNNIIRIEKH